MPPTGYGYGRPPAYVRNNGFAIASLVLGLIGIPLCGLTSPFAVIFGHLALPQIERSQGTEKGREMAIGGLALGYLFIVFWLVMLVIAVVAGDDSSTNR